MKKLPADVTIRFLIRNGLLNKPEEYVRGIWENCRHFEELHGPYCVRLGLSGTGHAPNYVIEFKDMPEEKPTTQQALDHFRDVKSHPRLDALTAANNAFNGRSHKIAVTGLAGENWGKIRHDKESLIKILQEFIEARKRT